MKTFKQLLTCIALITHAFAMGMEAPPLALTPLRKTQQLQTDAAQEQKQSLKEKAAELVMCRLQEGTIDVALIEQTWGEDLKDLIKEKLVHDNLSLFASMFRSISCLPLSGHEDYIYQAAFDRSGRYVMTESKDLTIRLWDLRQQTPEGIVILKNPGTRESAAFNSNFSSVLTCSGQDITEPTNWMHSCVYKRDLTTNPFQWEQVGCLHDSITILAFSPNEKYAFAGGIKGKAKLWELSTKKPMKLARHKDTVTSVAFSKCGTYILTGSADHLAILQKIEADKVITIAYLAANNGGVRAVAISPCGKYALTGYDDGMIRLWDLTKNPPTVLLLAGHQVQVKSLSFSPCGRYVLSCASDNSARLWDLQKKPLTGQIITGTTKSLNFAQFSPDGKHVLVTGWQNSISCSMQCHVRDLYGEPQKLSLTQLLLIIAASKELAKARELVKACVGIEGLHAYYEATPNVSKAEIAKACHNQSIRQEVAKLTSEQRNIIAFYRFANHPE